MSDIEAVVVPKELYYHEVAYVRGLEAEIADLNHRLDIAAEERHARLGQLERLREAKDTFFQNAEAWEAKCNAAWKERDEAKAEIARLTEARDTIAQQRNELTHDIDWEILRAEKAEAEVARLTAENQRFKELIRSETAWLRSLGGVVERVAQVSQGQPDTGEKPSPLQAIADILKPFTFKGVKPDTGEKA